MHPSLRNPEPGVHTFPSKQSDEQRWQEHGAADRGSRTARQRGAGRIAERSE